eukprot:SAG31_NODE_1481_length_8176_cov_3.282531_5_plen_98_part_00
MKTEKVTALTKWLLKTTWMSVIVEVSTARHSASAARSARAESERVRKSEAGQLLTDARVEGLEALRRACWDLAVKERAELVAHGGGDPLPLVRVAEP